MLAIAEPDACLGFPQQGSLQAVVFAAFALEYRLRTVYDALGLVPRDRDGLWDLASKLEQASRGRTGLNGKPVKFSAEWRTVLPRINRLSELRNRIAHGKANKVGDLITDRSPSMKVQARRGYNSFIDAVRIINVAIGYEWRRGEDRRQYYAALRVRRG